MQLNAPKWAPRQSVTQQGGLITIALNQSGVRFTGLSYLCWGVNGECEDNGDRNQQFNESKAAMVSIFTEKRSGRASGGGPFDASYTDTGIHQ